MRRSLVLTDEASRHPFRASLPPHVCAFAVDDVEQRIPWRDRLPSDVRGFVQAYCACFLAVTAFIV